MRLFFLAKLSEQKIPYKAVVVGIVGRAVASDTRDPQFESRHWQNFIYQLRTQNTEKTKIKERGREWPIFKKIPYMNLFLQIMFPNSSVTVKILRRWEKTATSLELMTRFTLLNI